jgi:hypothetical protein
MLRASVFGVYRDAPAMVLEAIPSQAQVYRIVKFIPYWPDGIL